MPLIVCTAEPDFSINFVNNQFENYTGMPQKDALGNGWHEVISSEDLKALLQSWKNAVHVKADFEKEIRVKTQSGEYQWNLLRAKARFSNGELINWVITIIDIHSQKVLNETLERKVIQRTQELQQMNEALEASNHDLQQFASVASHDLQEPLRKIHMFSKLIKDKHANIIPTDARQYLEKIMQSSTRMKSIITNVLNFSRLSADDNNFELIDLNDLISDLKDDLEVTIKERNATIDVISDCKVEVIPGQIRQVFQNLISNSLKFSQPDVAPVINIQAELVEEKAFDSRHLDTGGFCRISIRDNGIGFEDKFKENIFALFHRLHSKDRYEGTGIGLAIVKKIVEKHHGIITAHSKAGEGATFVIVLPTVQQQKQNEIIQYDQANTSRG
jgi:two-component system CheB/CheR fusion protein